MGTIVVGLDGSEGSLEAMRFALEEARVRGARVRAVHAWQAPLFQAAPDPFLLEVPSMSADPNMLELVETGAGRLLDDAIDKATGGKDPGVEIERLVVDGAAAASLIETAEGADLLVVGTRGHGGFRGLLLGSVSQQCVHHAPCPIVIVPAPHNG
jgi:nucleotide-binding universal stress UspA family protein